MNKAAATLLCLIFTSCIYAQIEPAPATSAQDRLKNTAIRSSLDAASLVKNVPFESIGPSIFSGRVSDVAVRPDDPTHFYVAYASGGLWKTENNGQSFTPIFDDEIVMTLGDIAVDWTNNIIWAGTGEVNSSRSSYSGVGVYKSMDGGKTWQHKGLAESHHIGRVILHPENPNIAWVAALGHLYSPNKERGVYKTTDGGDSWEQVLFVDENSGAIDLVIDPSDNNTLYAATWHRERSSWNFVESGQGSGIYKSTDGGINWIRLNTPESGFPHGNGVGRIGLDIAIKNGQSQLVAIVDNQNRRPADEEEEEGLTKEDFKTMTKATFLQLEKEDLEIFLEDNRFPKKYSTKKVIQMVESDEILPPALAEYLENANALLFDTPVIGAEVYQSGDQGKSWQKTHEDFLDGIYFSYGYYFGQIRMAKHNPDKLYIFGVPILISENGGKDWSSISQSNVHSDHHALWINPERDQHLILGNDGGINISYDDGENWIKCNTPPVGQFYHIEVDMEKNYNVYGGLQDNGSWYGPHSYEASNRWHNSGQYPYKSFVGGDGMQTAVDTRDNNTIYGGFQFGFYFRINKQTGKRTRITPRHDLGERPYRWNWQTPIYLSKHNQDILYMGAHKLFRSLNQGDDWDAISPDLTKGGLKGDVPFGTISCIHESPLKFGMLYVGTDDGYLHLSKDGGNTWDNISGQLPQNRWVSRVQASKYEKGRVYVSLNGYRWDNFEALVYRSDDFGKTWTQIGTNLPMEPVNVIKEDPVNEDLVYVGTDHGLYVSLDRGITFMPFKSGLPAVPVHDVVVHPRDHDLLVGTHGRSIYIADAAHIQKLNEDILEKPLYVYEIADISYRDNWGSKRRTWSTRIFEPEVDLVVYAKAAGTAQIIISKDEMELKSWEETLEAGLNYLKYDASLDEASKKTYEEWLNKNLEEAEAEIELMAGENEVYYLQPGSYTVTIRLNKDESSTNILIED